MTVNRFVKSGSWTSSMKGPLHHLSFPLQVITVFTLVDVQLKADGAPTKYSAVLKRPDDDRL